MAAPKVRGGMTVGAMLTLVFIVFAASLAASLAVQFAEALTEMSSAQRTAALAAADAAIFRGTQTLRASRGKVQTLVVNGEPPEIKELLLRNEAQLKAVHAAVDPGMAENVTALLGRIQQTAALVAPLEAGVLAAAAKPK